MGSIPSSFKGSKKLQPSLEILSGPESWQLAQMPFGRKFTEASNWELTAKPDAPPYSAHLAFLWGNLEGKKIFLPHLWPYRYTPFPHKSVVRADPPY